MKMLLLFGLIFFILPGRLFSNDGGLFFISQGVIINEDKGNKRLDFFSYLINTSGKPIKVFKGEFPDQVVVEDAPYYIFLISLSPSPFGGFLKVAENEIAPVNLHPFEAIKLPDVTFYFTNKTFDQDRVWLKYVVDESVTKQFGGWSGSLESRILTPEEFGKLREELAVKAQHHRNQK